ncbi:MAG: periplasmic heavy metal sensor [Candidatus Omnitrophota bacterium]|nr:periplasmic heavy metal sensor [Candidatus Omnitrophota bacterium]
MILVSLVIAVLISGNALAEQECGFHGQREKGSKAKEMITSELNLSVDQQNRLEQEKVAHREVMEKMRGALKEKRAELRDAIAKPGTTKEQVEPILAQIKKLQADMADKRMDGIFAVKGILSPEQFTKLQAMKEKKMQAGKVSLAR